MGYIDDWGEYREEEPQEDPKESEIATIEYDKKVGKEAVEAYKAELLKKVKKIELEPVYVNGEFYCYNQYQLRFRDQVIQLLEGEK